MCIRDSSITSSALWNVLRFLTGQLSWSLLFWTTAITIWAYIMLTLFGYSNLVSGQFKHPIMYQNQQPIGLCGHEETYPFIMQTIQMPMKLRTACATTIFWVKLFQWLTQSWVSMAMWFNQLQIVATWGTVSSNLEKWTRNISKTMQHFVYFNQVWSIPKTIAAGLPVLYVT